MKALLYLIAFLPVCFCFGGPNDFLNHDKGPPYQFSWPDKNLLEAFDVSAYPSDPGEHPEEYRIFYLPPFSSPFLVLIKPKRDQTCTIMVRRLSGMGGYPDNLGELNYEDSFEIETKQTMDLLKKMRSDEVYNPLGNLTDLQVAFLESLDGNGVIIERVYKGKHSVARVSSPRFLVKQMDEFIKKQGLTVYEKVNLVPFTDAFEAVSKIVGFEFGAYGEVTIKKR